MHIISKERALAHWQALYRLPVFAAELLRERFIEEQPSLAATLLTLTGGTYTNAEGKPVIHPENAPERKPFDQISLTAALAAEVLRREARRPLRKLEETEVRELLQSNLDIFDALKKADDSKPETMPDVIGSCSQPNLLGGLMVALRTEKAKDDGKYVLRTFLLRVVLNGLHRACGGDAETAEQAWDADRLVVALASQGDPLRREALVASEALRAELTPQLISELETWVEDPKAALEEDGSLGTHGMFLLAKWREESAWPVFRKLFSLPGGLAYDLLGDLITEDGSILLAMAGGHRRDELRAMVEDVKLDEYCRNACIDALTCLVAWGELPRAEQVAWLRELLAGKLRDVPENEHAFGGVVSAACDLEAWELRPEIEAAYERGVVDDGFIDLKCFLDCQAGKHRRQWLAFCDRHQPITDVAAATKWLDNPPPKDDPPLPPLDDVLNVIAESDQPYIAPPKVGRNEPCPCGSGKKYKKCCGP
jgi:hypothetical protein